MAKVGKSIKLNKCIIDVDKGVFVEETKDEQLVYSIADILSEFQGLSNVNINITWTEDMESKETEY